MTTQERLNTQIEATRRAGNQREFLSFLTTLAAEISRIGKDKGNRATTEDEAKEVLIRWRKGAKEMHEAARNDAERAKAEQELAWLAEYLPAALTDAELGAAIDAIIAELGGAPPVKAVMSALSQKYAGRYDGAKAAPAVRAKLGL